MSIKPSMRTPLSRVRGLGSAHAGTDHFWLQRVTALSNVPLVLVFIGVVIAAGGRDYEAARAIVSHPAIAICLLLLVVSVCVHMRLGLQIVIEDYVHGHGAKFAATIANTFFAFAVGAALGFAVLKISFGA